MNGKKSKRCNTYAEAVEQVVAWARATPPRKRVSPKIMMERVSAFRKLYSGNLPGDLDQAVQHACKKSKAMYRAEPTTIYLSTLFKYGFAKCALVRAWQQHVSASKRSKKSRGKEENGGVHHTQASTHVHDIA